MTNSEQDWWSGLGRTLRVERSKTCPCSLVREAGTAGILGTRQPSPKGSPQLAPAHRSCPWGDSASSLGSPHSGYAFSWSSPLAPLFCSHQGRTIAYISKLRMIPLLPFQLCISGIKELQNQAGEFSRSEASTGFCGETHPTRGLALLVQVLFSLQLWTPDLSLQV